MNKILIPALLAMGIGSAFAQTPATNANAATEDAPAAAETAAQKSADSFCLRQTGSHLHAIAKVHGERAVQCASDPGRSYSREDIERTGATTTAQALRLLDPSIH